MDIYFFIDNNSMEIHWFDFITLFLFALFLYGTFKDNTTVYVKLNFFITVSIGFYMVYKFNHFRKVFKISLLDKKICAFAGFYILIFSFADVITLYSDKIRNYIKSFLASGA